MGRIRCGLCHFEFEHGVHVCQGCTGIVVYGSTAFERKQAFQVGFLVWGGGTLLAIYFLPTLLNTQLGWSLTSGLGLEIWGLLVGFVAGLLGGAWGVSKLEEQMRGQIRTFRN